MKNLKNLLDFYIESSLHVALAVYALIQITYYKLDLPSDESVVLFGFFGTIVGYNFIKYDELARVKKIKLNKMFKAIIGLSFFSFIIAFYYFLELKALTKFVCFITLGITILYTLPLFPKKSNMRNWSGIKIYLVAIAWVAVTVVLPVLNSNYIVDVFILLKSIQRFLLVFILMLVFEIIDLKLDDKSLQTIPQKIGINSTKMLIFVLLFFFTILDFLNENVKSKHLYITILVTIIICLFTVFANSKRNKYYTSFWVESVPLIWLLLLNFI
ncbi:conserved membrane hypothetical protein [Flavobacterium sp. 9AF]|uniref:hypothetical protein n=1 Tax=Flavobacterium sp. 9AF TaxID=2653142 RepID=UPI0012F08219|nr:hypothetical protein [Flavobacterium sp. 9AF]VXA94837.1 conserved membrane hypothetical protein [Flavobacterium sp. 9AF]